MGQVPAEALRQHIVIWTSQPGLAGALVELARLMGISYTIPHGRVTCSGNTLVVADPSTVESVNESCDRTLVVDTHTGNLITHLLDVVKAIRGRVYEAIVGIDVGSSRLAYVVLSAGAVIYSGFEPLDSQQLISSICIASRRHPELAVAIGSSPAVLDRALEIMEMLEACNARVYLVDEYRSNTTPLLGVKGIEKLGSDDLRAAAAIALRVYMNGHRRRGQH